MSRECLLLKAGGGICCLPPFGVVHEVFKQHRLVCLECMGLERTETVP